MPAGRLLGDQRPIDRPVDTDERDLGNTQPGKPQLHTARAAADVEDPVANPGTQALDQEGRKRFIPPVVANVLECR